MTELEIYNRANAVVSNPDISWEKKYEFVFSEHVSKKVDIEWCDPDGSYEEDVQAFMFGFKWHIEHHYKNGATIESILEAGCKDCEKPFSDCRCALKYC